MKNKILVFFSGLFISCNTIINTLYEDTTARYNAYFIGNEIINEIETDLYEKIILEYDSLIELTYKIDTNLVSNIKQRSLNSIQKLSILIQRHPDSKYVYPSYSLIGKSRMLSQDIKQAITTLKYVNSKSDNQKSKNMSLIYLMRAYTENKDYDSAVEVYQYLKNITIEKDLKIEFLLNSYHLFKILNKKDEIFNALFELENIVKKKNLLNKVYFALGQMYLSTKNYEKSKEYVNKCLKNNPSFEMEFYSKIYIARASSSLDQNSMEDYFKKLIRDKKNLDFQDRIYYEHGQYYETNKNFEEAIKKYILSVSLNKGNRELLFDAYIKTADIYYYDIINYKLSKLYYDSALTNINRENVNYNIIKNRSEVLTDLVKNIDKINLNDSLIKLTTLPKSELISILENKIKSTEKKSKGNNLRNNNFILSEPEIIISDNKGVWYFNNPSIISTGLNEFKRKWGNRELKDNWRISSKITFIASSENESNLENNNLVKKEINSDPKGDINSLMNELPFDPKEVDILNLETEKAFFDLGKIYIQKLDEIEKGVETYQELIERFDESQFLEDVYYQLYLVSNNKNYYRDIMIEKFPESTYTKLILNPNYEIDEFREYNEVRDIYNDLYSNLVAGMNDHVILKVDSLNEFYNKNPFFENILLLKSIASGKKNGNFSLQFELKDFLDSANEESTIEYATTLLKASEKVHKEFIFSGLPKFSSKKSDRYFFVIVNDDETETYEKILNNILKDMRELKVRNSFYLKEDILLDVLLINNYNTLKKLERKFNKELNNENLKLNTNFVISEENLNLIFKSKNYSAYASKYNR